MIRTLLLTLALSGPLAAADRPNILLLLPDQLRACSVGCYGDEQVQTPHIDQLAAQARDNGSYAFAIGTFFG